MEAINEDTDIATDNPNVSAMNPLALDLATRSGWATNH